ncbi:hypothetical protein K505DRAFT_365717 [Melanomma pulvis-pyrius CBS 109.77]|uniref:Uncharacterized protein n=1 Tax=Melanomma pulvis-pyrius CBS 109.77 TaxID=1314802 RepID=A0A6A6X080_9PLEO|nr:hypothetical protein K505DRAFT_365717 [Melanomma pulvis-pyrius CBS 109.77]
MDKLKQVITGNRKNANAAHEGETSPTTTSPTHGATGALSGEGSHLAGTHQAASTGATGSEGHHPIYDQFKGQHAQTATSGEPTRTTEHPPHFSNSANVTQPSPASAGAFGTSEKEDVSAPASSLRQDAAHRRPDVLSEDASTASIRSGVIGFPQGGYDTHASLGNNPIKRELDSNQLKSGPGSSTLTDRTVDGESKDTSHLGRDAALGAGTVGAGGAAVHELRHHEGDVSSTAAGNSSTRPLESQSERRTEHASKGTTGHSSTHPHHSHTERQTEQIPQQQSARIGEQKESSHLGRDAAVGAGVVGAGGVAAHEHNRRQEGDASRGITGQSNTLAGQGQTEGRSQPISQQPPSRFGEQEKTSHLGRDAAVGAGALGAGGLAANELNRRHDGDVSRGTTGASTNPSTQGLGQSTTPATHGLTEQRSQPTSQQLSGNTGEKEKTSHLGRDAAIGAGAVGAGGLAAHTLSNRREDHISRDATQHNTTTEGTTGTNRSFPLAGGVATSQPTQHSPVATSDREPGTKEKEVGVVEDHSHGREALAGAAAAGVASSGIHSSQHAHERERDHTGLAQGATTTTASSTIPLSQQERRPTGEHDHAGHGHTFTGDPCKSGAEPSPSGTMFSGGPHVTDTANRVDPHLHIPGEFPDPTPAEEISEPSFGGGAGVATTGGLRDTPTGQTKSTLESDKPTSEHHYGRDAAVAGGVGAAGLGAAAAGRHHQKETPEIGGSQFPRETSPYSSKTVDPRIYGKTGVPDNTTEQSVPSSQLRDASKSTHDRDAAVAAGYETSKQHGGLQGNVQPSTSREVDQPSSQAQDEQSKHHYGRDAALVGAGAATAGGLYASQRDDKPETGPASGTIGPHKSNVANVVDPKVHPDPALQQHQVGSTSTPQDPATKTIGPHKSNILNILDPRVQPDPEKQKSHPTTDPSTAGTPKRDTQPEDKHHYGRDAAVVGGTGAAGYGAYEAGKAYDSHRNTQSAASMDEQRYDPSASSAHDPTQPSQHHHGRDAAVAGGVGAAGAGTYAATKSHEGSTLQPSTSEGHVHYPTAGSPEEPYRGGSPHQGKDAAVAGGVGAAGAGAYTASKDAPPTSFAQQLQHEPTAKGTEDPKQLSEHHYGRDAAIAGGLGTAGAGAYAATRKNDTPESSVPQQQHHDPTTQVPSDPNQQSQHHYGRDAAVAGGVGAAGAGTYAATRGNESARQPQVSHESQQPNVAHQRYDSAQVPDQPQHQKRDTAALGAAGVAAGAGAGYGLSQHDAEKAEKERLAQQKAHDKDLEHQRKEQQKELEKQQKGQQKELEKQHTKEEKQHNKLAAAEDKHHQKELAKEEKQHQKEAEKLEKEEEKGEKKHHLFGFLHRDKKDKQDKLVDEKSESGAPRDSQDYAAGGTAAAGVGAAGIGAGPYEDRYAGDQDSDSDGKRQRARLHKDPPPGHPAREAMESGKNEHMGTDGPIGRPDQVSGDHTTQSGVFGAHEPDAQTRTVT